MNESRVSQLLKHSRSRHQVIVNPDLRKASWEFRSQKRRSRQVTQNLQKIMSEMRYFQSLNKRLSKDVSKRRKDLGEAQSVRSRYNQDLRNKQKLQELKQQQINKNKSIAEKIKAERLKRIGAVKNNIIDKYTKGDYTREEKQRVRNQRFQQETCELIKNRSRVEQIVQFQCNLRESYVRKKQKNNMNFLRSYRRQIQEERTTMELRRKKTQQIRSKLRILTEGTERQMNQISSISSSLRKYNPHTPTSPIVINKQKLMSKSRCYTMTNASEQQNTYNNSLFMSQHRSQALN